MGVPNLEAHFPKGTEMENEDLQNEFMSSPVASFSQGGAFSVVILHQVPESIVQMKIFALFPPVRGRGAGSVSSSLESREGPPFPPSPAAEVPGPVGAVLGGQPPHTQTHTGKGLG